MKSVRFRLNGERVEKTVAPNDTLLDFLRKQMRLTSVKKGCDVGECGACTVLLNGKPVRSCLLLAVQAEDTAITTLEGLARGDRLSAVQEAFLETYGFQCGFCTPGMILATMALLDENANPTVDEIKDALEGNLCRCTGYEQIIGSVLKAARLKLQQEGH